MEQEQAEIILAGLGLTVVMVSPAILLILLRRWLRRWWAALMLTMIILVPVAFFTVGGVAWWLTNERVAVEGAKSIPVTFEGSADGYLSFIFVMCGAYGVMFAAMGLALSIPILIAWSAIHRKSFQRLTRSEKSLNLVSIFRRFLGSLPDRSE